MRTSELQVSRTDPVTGRLATTNNITTDIAQFGYGGTLASTATINVSTQSINGLIFGATTTSGYTLTASSAGQVLSIGASGIVVNSGAQAALVGSMNLGITLGASQTWTNRGAGALTVSGGGSGTSDLVLNANAAGAITVGAGMMGISGGITNSGTGAGAVTISGSVTGITQNSATSQLTLSGANSAFTGGVNIKAGFTTYGLIVVVPEPSPVLLLLLGLLGLMIRRRRSVR